MGTLRTYCTAGCVLREGGVEFFDTIDGAIDLYEQLTNSRGTAS
jgi:ABC-type polysaccharide/polyol phosphate transport system ATPase subunit